MRLHHILECLDCIWPHNIVSSLEGSVSIRGPSFKHARIGNIIRCECLRELCDVEGSYASPIIAFDE